MSLTAMPAPGIVLDGSWKEDNTYPVSEGFIKRRAVFVSDIMKRYGWDKEKAEKWYDEVDYPLKRHDGLIKKPMQKPDGTWTWIVHMQYTSEQQRSYDYICTM